MTSEEAKIEGGRFSVLKGGDLQGEQTFFEEEKANYKYVVPYKLHERIGAVAYKLDLPSKLDAFHKIFHVSQFRKCL